MMAPVQPLPGQVMIGRVRLLVVRHWRDVVIAVLLGAAFSCATYQVGRQVPALLLTPGHHDVWFESDTPRVYGNMTSRSGDHGRDKVHPLFSLLSYSSVTALERIFGLDAVSAVRVMIAAVSFVWACLFFSFLRLLGCPRGDTVLFALLGCVSAASVFFFTVPETYSFGSASILVALLFVVLSDRREFTATAYVLVNLVTLSMTTTNWMFGALITFINRRFKEAVQIVTNAFAVATVLWAIQGTLFSGSKFFLVDIAGERKFTFTPGAGPLNAIGSFFYHTLVMPAIYLVARQDRPQWPGMDTQLSVPGSGSVYGVCAIVLWTVLLAIGMWALFFSRGNVRLRLVLGVTLACQLAFHVAYGAETFLYSLHFIVLLIAIAALGSLTPWRKVVLIGVFLLIPCVAVNNFIQFNKAVDYFHGRM